MRCRLTAFMVLLWLSAGARAGSGETCADAIVVTGLPFTSMIDTGLADSDAPPGSCNAQGTTVMRNAVWYRWTPDSRYEVTVTITELESYDMIASIHTGTCGGLTELVCLNTPEPLTHTFIAERGVTYTFQLGDYGTLPRGGLTEFALSGTLMNHSCESALIVPQAPFTFTFDNSTAPANGPPGTCNSGGAVTMQNAAWFSWRPRETVYGILRVTAIDPYDMIVRIAETTGTCSFAFQEYCADTPQPIEIVFFAGANVTYFFQCGDAGLVPGGGETLLELDFDYLDDSCAEWESLYIGAPRTVDTTLADAGLPVIACDDGGVEATGRDRWFEFTSRFDAQLTLHVDASGHEAIVGVYEGPCIFPTLVACGRGTGSFPAEFEAEAGVQYFVQVGAAGGPDASGGLVDLDLRPNYKNETCATATGLFGAPVELDFGNAGAEPGLPAGSCNFFGTSVLQSDLWWKWQAPLTGTVEMRVDAFPTWVVLLAVHEGSCGGLTQIACNRSASVQPIYATVMVDVVAGETYYIQVGSAGMLPLGDLGTLSISYPTPPNDDCADALTVSEGSWIGHNMNCNNDGSSSCGTGAGNRDVWYRYEAPVSGELQVSTCGTVDLFIPGQGLDSVISVHDPGCPAGPGSEIACSDDDIFVCDSLVSPLDAFVAVDVQAGAEYLIQVGGFGIQAEGVFVLNVSLVPACDGDADGDLAVTFSDLNLVLEDWNTAVPPGTGGDVTRDGVVDFADLNTILEEWGRSCLP